MADNDKTYRLRKSLNLFSAATTAGGCKRWEITMLDEKLFPSMVCAQIHTDDTMSTIIKIYDINNIPVLIIEFILPHNVYFHKTPSSISPGLNYDDGILTFMEKVHPTLTDFKVRDTTIVDFIDSNSNLYKITRYLLSNEGEKKKMISTYIISGHGAQICHNRAFCHSSLEGMNIYDLLDGHLIESIPVQWVCKIASKQLVALESKTQIILYCTMTGKKNIIDKHINGVLYCGKLNHPARPGVMEYRENSTIEELGKNHIMITMHTENKTQYASLLYKLIEDTDVDEKDQCCVCFHFTEKNKALIPCGHTQFCEKCIGTLKRCPLCEKEISSILPIYK